MYLTRLALDNGQPHKSATPPLARSACLLPRSNFMLLYSVQGRGHRRRSPQLSHLAPHTLLYLYDSTKPRLSRSLLEPSSPRSSRMASMAAQAPESNPHLLLSRTMPSDLDTDQSLFLRAPVTSSVPQPFL
nr:unnamed protein product [Digitaria exilis]